MKIKSGTPKEMRHKIRILPHHLGASHRHGGTASERHVLLELKNGTGTQGERVGTPKPGGSPIPGHTNPAKESPARRHWNVKPRLLTGRTGKYLGRCCGGGRTRFTGLGKSIYVDHCLEPATLFFNADHVDPMGPFGNKAVFNKINRQRFIPGGTDDQLTLRHTYLVAGNLFGKDQISKVRPGVTTLAVFYRGGNRKFEIDESLRSGLAIKIIPTEIHESTSGVLRTTNYAPTGQTILIVPYKPSVFGGGQNHLCEMPNGNILVAVIILGSAISETGLTGLDLLAHSICLV